MTFPNVVKDLLMFAPSWWREEKLRCSCNFRMVLKPSAPGEGGSPSAGWTESSCSYWVTSTFQLGRMDPDTRALSSFQTKPCQGFWQCSGQGTRQGKEMSQLRMRGLDTASLPAEWELMQALTFSLVPFAPVESARSLPARSTRLILLTCRQR